MNRFLDNKEDIAKLRKCFAGLWSLDESSIVEKAIENPELFVMKPQREGGGLALYLNIDSTYYLTLLKKKLT